MNWDDLRIIAAVRDAGSYAGASRRLRIDETTVGRRLQRLERALGAKLFEAVDGTRRPTAQCDLVLSHVETIAGHVAEIAKIVLDAGAAADREAVTSALDLAASSRVARECGVQQDLIAVLCEYGGDAASALLSPALYGEFEAVEDLLAHGAGMTLPAAAALGRSDDVRSLLPQAGGEERRLALALAAQHAREAAVRLILEAGTDPNGFIPVQGHAHATPLHQAALAGSEQIVRLLLEHGARADVRDILYGGTPADWARYAHHDGVAALLK